MRSILLLIAAALLSPLAANAAMIDVPENVAPWGLSASQPPDNRGIYANFADAMKERASLPIEIRFVPYGRMLQDVHTGSADYAFGVIGPATTEAAPFIATVASVPMVAVARKGLTLKAIADLHGFSEVGYLRGGSCGALVDGDAAIKRTAQDGYDTAIRKLAAGRLDGWCSIKPGFTYALKNLNLDQDIGDQLEYGQVKIGFQVTRDKLDTPEAKAMAALVDQLVTEGVTARIFERYVGVAFRP